MSKTLKQTIVCRGTGLTSLDGLIPDSGDGEAKIFIRRTEEISTECPDCELLRSELLDMRSSRAFMALNLLIMTIGFLVSFYFLCLISKH